MEKADFSILLVGVIPNMTLAAEAGIRISQLGIWEDEHLRTDAKAAKTSENINMLAAKDALCKGWATMTISPSVKCLSFLWFRRVNASQPHLSSYENVT